MILGVAIKNSPFFLDIFCVIFFFISAHELNTYVYMIYNSITLIIVISHLLYFGSSSSDSLCSYRFTLKSEALAKATVHGTLLKFIYIYIYLSI